MILVPPVMAQTAPGAAVPVVPAAPVPAAPASAASAAQAPAARVEILGGRLNEIEQRRLSTAAKIVIGREQIEQYGDATLGEVLRRLAGVSTGGRPGRGGAPRLRGLGGGYTQLLIDGERIPGGFALESLTPEQVERIEILRAPTAETGARAVGGTLNIVTREGFRRRLNELRASLGVENGRFTPGLFWSRADTAGALGYTLAAGGHRRATRDAEHKHTQQVQADAVTGERQEKVDRDEIRSGLNLGGRLQWKLGEAGDSLLLHPTLFHADRRSRSLARQAALGPAAPDSDRADSASTGRFTVARLNLQWRQRLGDAWRAEASGFASHWRSSGEGRRDEYGGGQATPTRVVEDSALTTESALKLGTKLSALVGGGEAVQGAHQLVLGLELEALQRDDRRELRQDGVPLLAEFGDNLSARSTRVAAYAQDEWSLSPQWALHAGLRWEGIETVGDPGDGSQPRHRSGVTTPLLHAVYRPDPRGRDQIRLSLTRSYKSPPLGSLIARPTINPRHDPAGPNLPTEPDRAGNPGLRPELATGLDLAWERYGAGGGVLSANLFHRRIRNLMRSQVVLEDVSWSPVPRWVSRQFNLGDAVTSGVELEAKGRLDQWDPAAPRLDLNANLSLYRSRVDAVPGPDNRLSQQAGATLNLGADYRLPGAPLKVGGNLNWVPGYRTRLSAEQWASVSTRRVLDAYVLWTVSPALALRLSAGNLAPRDSVELDSVSVGGLTETTTTTAPSFTNWQLRLELRL